MTNRAARKYDALLNTRLEIARLEAELAELRINDPIQAQPIEARLAQLRELEAQRVAYFERIYGYDPTLD